MSKDKKYDFGVWRLTSILMNLNTIIDRGSHFKCSYEQMMELITNKRVLEYISTSLELDISLEIQDPDFVYWFNNVLCSIIENVSIYRKFGVKDNGIPLLISCIIEMIAHDKGKWMPDSNNGNL